MSFYSESSLARASLREIEGRFFLPAGFVTKDGFGCPYAEEYPSDNMLQSVVLIQARHWMQKVESCIFQQFRLPFTSVGSDSNKALYERMSGDIGWNIEEEQKFWDFAVELPRMGGAKANDKTSKYTDPVLNFENNGFLLRQLYTIGKRDMGMIAIQKQNIRIHFAQSKKESVVIPFFPVRSKLDACNELFPEFRSETVRYVDLSVDGGIAYAQVSDPVQKNQKLTYADCTRWLQPNIGGMRQIWIRVEDGIPGSKQGIQADLRSPLGAVRAIFSA